MTDQHAINQEIIDEMLADGLDPEEYYQLEHHFCSQRFDALELMASEAAVKDYGIGEPMELEDDEGKVWFCVDVFSEQPLEPAKINAETDYMMDLAKRHNVEYEGWGTYLDDYEE